MNGQAQCGRYMQWNTLQLQKGANYGYVLCQEPQKRDAKERSHTQAAIYCMYMK